MGGVRSSIPERPIPTHTFNRSQSRRVFPRYFRNILHQSSTPSAMPPRPRPRPANRQASDQTQHVASSSVTQSVSHAKTDRELELDKGDEFFLRNRNRTANDWKKLDKLAKEQASPPSDKNSDGEEFSDASSGTPRKRRKARHREENDLPEWTRKADITLLDSDDESDAEGVTQEVDESPSNAARANKRTRSRSRSLTPPPELSLEQILNVRHVVRTELGSSLRPDSPSNENLDDSMDTTALDEDLASIAREVRAQVKSGGDLGGRGGPENVTINVHWQFHPGSADDRTNIWTFVMKRHDTFHTLFHDIAHTAGILTGSLVLTHNGSRVFASATPHSLKVWAEAQMDASDVATFEYLREHRHEGPASVADANDPWSSPPPSAEDGGSESDAQSIADDGDGDVFKLVVRSAVAKDVTLKVRPTTSCGAIVKAFLKRAGIADTYVESRGEKGPQLMVDGEHMNPETPISEADLEDGDQVEVDGL